MNGVGTSLFEGIVTKMDLIEVMKQETLVCFKDDFAGLAHTTPLITSQSFLMPLSYADS